MCVKDIHLSLKTHKLSYLHLFRFKVVLNVFTVFGNTLQLFRYLKSQIKTGKIYLEAYFHVSTCYLFVLKFKIIKFTRQDMDYCRMLSETQYCSALYVSSGNKTLSTSTLPEVIIVAFICSFPWFNSVITAIMPFSIKSAECWIQFKVSVFCTYR